MTQEVRVYDGNGNLKEVISDKRAREISEANFKLGSHPPLVLTAAIERKCSVCGAMFMTKKKRQVNCNSIECKEKKRELLKKAKQDKRTIERKLRILTL